MELNIGVFFGFTSEFVRVDLNLKTERYACDPVIED